MEILRNLSPLRKVLLFLFVANIIPGHFLWQTLGLIDFCHNCGTAYFWKEFFSIRDNGFWWALNIVLLFGFFLFKKGED